MKTKSRQINVVPWLGEQQVDALIKFTQKQTKREWLVTLKPYEYFNLTKWEEDLTPDNPLVVARIEGKTVYLVHSSILAKADFLGIPDPELAHTDSDIGILIDWVRMVRTYPWNSKKQTVKVFIPQI